MFVCFTVRRQQQPAVDAKGDNDKNVTDTPPGLGGTNIRYPSKFLTGTTTFIKDAVKVMET